MSAVRTPAIAAAPAPATQATAPAAAATPATPDAPLPPGPSGADAWRWMLKFRRQEGPLEVLAEIGEQYGDVAMLDLPRQRLAIVSGPEAVRHVLVANQDAYRKSNQYELLEPVLGKGLVTSEGPLWQRQRKLVQ